MARWEPLAAHPNLVALREAFASDEWDGSPSLFFVHDYHPGACFACLCLWVACACVLG